MPPFWLSRNKQVDNLETVPESYRNLYQESDDGRYHFKNDVDDPTLKDLISSVLSLEQTVVNERKTKKPDIDLSPLSDYGSSVEDIAAHITNLIREKEELSKKSDFDPKKIRDEVAQEYTKRHQIELDKTKGQVEALTHQLDNLLINNQILAVSEKHSPGKSELWSPILRQFIRSEIGDDGNRYAYVVDANGERRFSGVTAEPFSIEELLLEFKSNPLYAALFPSPNHSGGGTSPTTRRSGTGVQVDKLSSTEKIALGLQQHLQRVK